MTNLVIVESPAKCKKIESYLGENYKCIASYGHIRKLTNLKDIDIKNNFKPRFSIIDSKKNQIKKIKNLMKNINDVYIATDDDREGEAIGWHLCKILNLSVKNTKRIIFHEITKNAVLNAVKNPTRINMNIVNAQQSRQILDLLVGFMISPILWKHISRNSKKGLSAGRCQTPALKLVYENYKEIQDTKPIMVYKTEGYFTKMNIPFLLNFSYKNEDKLKNFLEKSKTHIYIIKKKKVKHNESTPPSPFTTSLLQQKANNTLHMSPKETMSISQKLYENGLITYMRTDSVIYSYEFIKTATQYIMSTWGEEYVSEHINKLGVNKSKENAQEAHESIRPTNININDITKNGFSPRESKLYYLIWSNTVESCMSNMKYNSMRVEIPSAENHIFYHLSKEITFKGWYIVNNNNIDNSEYNMFSFLKNNSKTVCKTIKSNVSIKNNKTHYTEARLVQLLEKKGIGRPSTYSSLVEKIQLRDYVKKEDVKGRKEQCNNYELLDNKITCRNEVKIFGEEKNKLVIKPLGIMVIEFLIENYDTIFNYNYTMEMELSLDEVALGKTESFFICKKCYEDICLWNNKIKNSAREEIQIDDIHSYMIGKYGPVIKYRDENDKIAFKPVRQDIDLNDLKNGKYDINDIVLERTNDILGKYENEDLILKKGKYGFYVEWGKKKCSLKSLQGEKTFVNIVDYIKKSNNNNINNIRTVSENISIRKSKYGLYIFYKKPDMKKPSFYKLNGFDGNILTCDKATIKKWIFEKYDIV